jgi:hypothetical protein
VRGTQMAIQLFGCAPAGYSKARQGDVNGSLSDRKVEKKARFSADVIFDPGCKIFPTLYFHVVSSKYINSTSRIRILLEKMAVKWQRHSLPITKPIRFTVFDLTCQANSVHGLFQIIYAKISKQTSSLRVFLLISCLFQACYTPRQSHILICAPRLYLMKSRQALSLTVSLHPSCAF